METSVGTSSYQGPFQTPLFTLPAANQHAILVVVFFFIFIAWAAYSAVAAYHWFRYSHRSWLAIPAIVMHVIVSGAIIIYIASGV